MEELKVHITASANEDNEFVIRTGEASKLPPPVKIFETGSILSPGRFIKVIKPNDQRALVVYSYAGLYIHYFHDPEYPFGAEIKGELRLNPDLQRFGINACINVCEGRTFSLKDLASLLKMNRLYFADRDQCNVIVESLNKFKASITIDTEQNKDSRGNNKQMYDKKIQSELPQIFTLKMPIFLGFPEYIFTVDLCFDTTDATVRIWLESIELQEIIMRERKIIIDAELEKFKGLILIEK